MSQLSSASTTSCSNCHQKNLIDMTCNELVSTVELLDLPNSLVVTGKIPTPTEVCNGLQILRPDLKTIHEEADVFIPHQVVHLASLECCSIKVIRDDTNVFVLLVHYYAEKKLTQHFPWNPQVKDAHQLALVLLLPNTEVLPYSSFQLMHCLGVTLHLTLV